MKQRLLLKNISLIAILFGLHFIFVFAYEAQIVNVVTIIKDNTPVALPAGGIYNNPVNVSLASDEGGALIYYTFDGENPSCLPNGTLYTQSILIENDSVIKAVACGQNGSRSGLMVESYDIEISSSSAQSATNHQLIINEVMWMGSTVSTADEWIELKNLGTSTIDLTGWFIERAGSGSSTILLEGLVAGGSYYLVSNFSSDNASSSLADTIIPDKVTYALSLTNAGEQLTLKDNTGAVVDQTPSSSWPAGINADGFKQSMERNSIPGDGLLPENWHTCTNEACNDLIYWDTEGNNYGTPKADNL